MIGNYKDYNNINQQSKESMIAKAAENSNTNEATLIANTDEVEALLRTISGQLTTIHNDLTTVQTKIDTQGAAIVSAIEALPHGE